MLVYFLWKLSFNQRDAAATVAPLILGSGSATSRDLIDSILALRLLLYQLAPLHSPPTSAHLAICLDFCTDLSLVLRPADTANVDISFGSFSADASTA
jgi:hypothetical protein